MSNALYMGRILLGRDKPIKKWTICKRCGEVLTSERSITWGEGQRCRWDRMEKEGSRVYRPRRKRTAGTGVPISDEKFSESGGLGYRRKKYQ